MKTQRLSISDKKNGKCIPLIEILDSIKDGEQLNWQLLWLDVTPCPNDAEYIVKLQETINKSEDGLPISFGSLKNLGLKFFQEIDLTVIGFQLDENLRRYKEDKEMYEKCDVVIEMIDGGFWEVISQDETLLSNLQAKYKEVEMIDLIS